MTPPDLPARRGRARELCGLFGGQGVLPTLQTVLARCADPTNEWKLDSWPQLALATRSRPMPPGLIRLEDFSLAFIGHPLWVDGEHRDADPQAVARALRRHGQSALAHIQGDFALAAWSETDRRGWLAIDRIGVHALAYAETADGVVFASTLDTLRTFPGVSTGLSAQGVYNYLHQHVSPGPHTVFKGLQRLPAGCCLEFGASGAMQPRPYWALRFAPQHGISFDASKREFVALLQSAVGDAAAGAEACGAFLSGGTDSSTVSGMLARTRSRPPAFSIGFDVPGYDEMQYALAAVQQFGLDHHAYYVKPADVVDAVPRIAASYDQPFGNASAIPTYYCARLAREHGVTRLLAGDGGDELFGGNERYAKYQLLAHYQRVPALLRASLIEPLLIGPELTRRMPVVKKLRSYVEQARPPMPQRYESYNLLQHLGVANVFTGDFLASVDADSPHQLMAQAHEPHRDDSLIDQMLAIDLRFVLADGDLPKVTRMCELAGVDVAFPLLDDRIVEFSAGLPARYKLRGTQLRWFFKQALLDFLPRKIITKPKHGFGLPVGAWLVDHAPLRELAAHGIGLLRHRGIVRPAFVDELIGTRLKQHPAYFGTMVWVLMMLGLWLDSRRL